MKYVTITNGSLGFYDTEIHTTIPSGAYEITDADYTHSSVTKGNTRSKFRTLKRFSWSSQRFTSRVTME